MHEDLFCCVAQGWQLRYFARPDTQRGTGYDPVHPSTGNNSVRSHAQDIKIIYIETFNKTVYFVKSIYWYIMEFFFDYRYRDT